MTDTQLPRRIAGDTCLPSTGETVFVRTLNALQRERAQEEAGWAAREWCRTLRKGGRKHASVLQQVRAMEPEDQAAYLAGHEVFMGRMQRAAAQKHPEPEKPEREADQTDEQWMRAADKWEADVAKVAEKRRKEEDRLWEAEKRKALGLEAKARQERCLEAVIEREFATEYLRRLHLETLRLAVRHADDHNAMRWEHVQEVEDLPDEDREHLLGFYYDIDPVRPSEVPT